MFHKFSPIACLTLLGLALTLAGCAGGSGGPARETSGPAPNANGYYKIGNPYQIDGVTYYPAVDWTYDETGIASWYGPNFHGKYTANGELYDMNALTAAHRTLPMPSVVQVTNLDNGRTIQLRINDRGPYARGRILDVSRRAAQLLGFDSAGTAKVRVKILVQESMEMESLAQRNGGAGAPPPPKLAALPLTEVNAEALAPPPGTAAAPPPPAANAPLTPPPVVALDASPAPVPDQPPPLSQKVRVLPVGKSQIYVQAGAFSRADNALHLKERLAPLGDVKVVGARVNGVDVYRVRFGPIKSVDEADSLLNKVIDSGIKEARITVD